MIYYAKIEVSLAGKKVKEEYLVDADSTTIVEAVITKEKEGSDFTILSTTLKQKLDTEAIIETGLGTFYECKVGYMDNTTETVYIESDSFDKAKEKLEGISMNPIEILSIVKTKILDVLK